ncbi:MAG: 16S rRNA (cytidine(1402)-2'-O)-methyltransferase [Actinomycetaceae bacterium]|nr:16S rRNA (cytidine(1402)-2'-O)-methyltransferase [Actinomycetaceae bacterium]
MSENRGIILLAATPIGNAGDASERLRTALEKSDLIAAEDTRKALALAARLGVAIKSDLISFHEHNEHARKQMLIEAARSGKTVLVISDAGMPVVSDPGYGLVGAAATAGVHVTVLPGPSAVLTALVLSGLPSDRFSFEGFLPRKSGQIKQRLSELAQAQRTMIFFESAKRVHDSLALMVEIFGAKRPACLCRELTKTYEEAVRADLGTLVEYTEGEVLGEICIVVGPAPATAKGDTNDLAGDVLELAALGVKLKDAAAYVAKKNGVRKNDLYQAALAAKDGK